MKLNNDIIKSIDLTVDHSFLRKESGAKVKLNNNHKAIETGIVF